jgi:hypothetical protein
VRSGSLGRTALSTTSEASTKAGEAAGARRDHGRVRESMRSTERALRGDAYVDGETGRLRGERVRVVAATPAITRSTSWLRTLGTQVGSVPRVWSQPDGRSIRASALTESIKWQVSLVVSLLKSHE